RRPLWRAPARSAACPWLWSWEGVCVPALRWPRRPGPPGRDNETQITGGRRGVGNDGQVTRPPPGPRLVIAGTHSGVGKTTIATGLIAALRRAGHRPAAAKAGPDFIDPGYHALASGRSPRNLDPWMCGADAVPPLAARAAAGADLLV